MDRNEPPSLPSALSVSKEEQLSLPPARDINKNLDSGQKAASRSCWSRSLLARPSAQEHPGTACGWLNPWGKGSGSIPGRGRGGKGTTVMGQGTAAPLLGSALQSALPTVPAAPPGIKQ